MPAQAAFTGLALPTPQSQHKASWRRFGVDSRCSAYGKDHQPRTQSRRRALIQGRELESATGRAELQFTSTPIRRLENPEQFDLLPGFRFVDGEFQ